MIRKHSAIMANPSRNHVPAVPASRISHRRSVRNARSHPVPECEGGGYGDSAVGEVEDLARRLLRFPLHLDLVARRFGHVAAQVDHRGRGQSAQAEQDPPRKIVAGPGAEQSQGDQRPDDEPYGLGAEHHADQLAPVLPVGVLADHHRADRVVAAHAEPEHEPEADQHPERRRQRRPQRVRNHDHRDQPVHVPAADQVGETPEHERADERGEQHGGVRRSDLWP
jgi:hypothetical protein